MDKKCSQKQYFKIRDPFKYHQTEWLISDTSIWHNGMSWFLALTATVNMEFTLLTYTLNIDIMNFKIS